jgi:hypothetical protein
VIKEILVERHLDKLRDMTENPDNICSVKKLGEVFSWPPFTGQQPIHTFCDLDGVVLSFSLKDGANFSALLALARIAQRSTELTLWSLRPQVADNFLPGVFERKSISYPPIINDRSLLRLKKFFSTVAPQAEINFSLGLKKLAKEGLFPEIDQVLDGSNQEVVLIGSSVFDRLEMGKLLRKLPKEKRGRLWYFDTGKIVL